MKTLFHLIAVIAAAMLGGCVSAPFGSISDDDARGLIFFDTETTGLNPETARIIEITVYSEEGWYSQLLQPGVPVPAHITGITGITTEMVANAPTFAEVAPEIWRRFEGRTAVAHNAQFDMRFLLAEFQRAGMTVTNDMYAICTLEAERLARGVKKNNTLTECIGRRGLKAENAHRAEDDVRSLIELYKCQKREGAALVPVPYSQE
jgi:DNA polymerase-3 subunit epsilon